MAKLCTKEYGSRPEGSRSLLPTVPNMELSRFLSGFLATALYNYSSRMERSQGEIL
jgi:hypothetical protein